MTNRGTESERGIALIVALLVMMLLSALALSLTMVTSTEERVADAFVTAGETFYAADAAFELAVQELALVPDWSRVLDGSAVASTFVGVQAASSGWPDGRARTSTEATALLTCRKTACTGADMDERTADRPWGPNNPRWRLFVHGAVKDLSLSGAVGSHAYVAVWVGDDPSENDGLPLVDGNETAAPNPGRGVLALLVHAYGPSSRRMIEGTVARAAGGVRVVSWREIR